jgi:hypothetical protein
MCGKHYTSRYPLAPRASPATVGYRKSNTFNQKITKNEKGDTVKHKRGRNDYRKAEKRPCDGNDKSIVTTLAANKENL